MNGLTEEHYEANKTGEEHYEVNVTLQKLSKD